MALLLEDNDIFGNKCLVNLGVGLYLRIDKGSCSCKDGIGVKENRS